MAKLSPAAQAVIGAYCAIGSPVLHHVRVAAALRAAADQLGFGDPQDPIINASDLYAIASELDSYP